MYNKFWYDEKRVEKVMIWWIESKGYKIMPETHKKKGVDIKAFNRNRGRNWFIEVKGYPREKKSMHAQKQNLFISALGQIIKRMNQKNGKYGVAFPDYEFYERKSLELPLIARKRLKINIFLVNKKKEVRQLTPNSSKFKSV